MAHRTLTGTEAGIRPFVRGASAGAGLRVATALAVFGAALSGLLLFVRLPPALGLAWVAAAGGGSIWLLLQASRRPGPLELGALAQPPGSGLVPAVLGAAGATAVLGNALDAYYGALPFVHPAREDAIAAYARDPVGLLAVVLVMVVAGPLLEELCFRGWLLRTLLTRMAPLAAISTSAALFALVHGRLTWIPTLFLSGLIFGYAVHLTGSVWAGVALHAGHNALVVLRSPFFPDLAAVRAWLGGSPAGAWTGPAVVLVAGVVLWYLAAGVGTGPRSNAEASPGR